MTLFDNFKRLFGAWSNGGSDRDDGPEGITCHDALQLVHDFIDGELEGRSHADVEAHFNVCQRCYPHLHMEQRYREAVRRACAEETAPPDLRTRVLDLVSGGRPDA